MNALDEARAERLDADLGAFSSQIRRLRGIRSLASRAAFVGQLVDSIRRVKYFSVLLKRRLSDSCADPTSDAFDPIKAAVIRKRENRIDEAFWFVFLSVHFGKHRTDGWRLARDVYGGMGRAAHWEWAEVSAHPRRFRRWLANHQARLREDGIARRFGNHRKYESIDAWKTTGTGAAVETYVAWVQPPRTHEMLFESALAMCNREPRATFAALYDSMSTIASFGRTGKFDYLTTVGNLGLAPIEPGSTFMHGATGPFSGGRLLFGGSKDATLNRRELEVWLAELGARLGVGMQVLEDALCNWQKRPGKFQRFRG